MRVLIAVLLVCILAFTNAYRWGGSSSGSGWGSSSGNPWGGSTGPYNPSPTFERNPFSLMADESAEEEVEIPAVIANAVNELEAALEQFSIFGSASNGGNWNFGGRYNSDNFKAQGQISNGGNWNAGFEYTFNSDDDEVEAIEDAQAEEAAREEAAENVIAALDNLEGLLEQFSIFGSASNGGNWNFGGRYNSDNFKAQGQISNGGNWNAGFEYTFNNDDEMESDDDEEDLEQFSINGSASNGGWNVGGSYRGDNGFGAHGSVSNNGWSAGGSYRGNNGWSAGGTVNSQGGWNANVGYERGGFNAGAQVSNGGNWGVGVGFKTRF